MQAIESGLTYSPGLRFASARKISNLPEVMNGMDQIAANVWIFRFPLKMLGTEVGRTVTVLKMRSGELLIHSTAPFTNENIRQIEQLGKPAWLADATLFHDTFAKQGKAAFPQLPYFAPDGFSKTVPYSPLRELVAKCEGELEIVELKGMPRVREHLFYHKDSRTLILADLVFNWGTGGSAWERFVRRNLIGITIWPGTSRLFKLCIKDRAAYNESLQEVFKWPFEIVIPGHGRAINNREELKAALKRAGFNL